MASFEDTAHAGQDQQESQVQGHQHLCASSLQSSYDFIVCGAGSAGSVVAARLAENPAVQVLLLEAGGTDDIPEILDPEKWAFNLGTNREWGFQTEASAHLNGRTMPYAMGRALGGGSSINVGVWSRGHKNDWEGIAKQSGDAGWGYDSVLQLYRSIEDFHGAPDPHYRGSGGPMYIENVGEHSQQFFHAALEAAESTGFTHFDHPNGAMMEAEGGCSSTDRIMRGGKRQSVYRSYIVPKAARPNLTVLADALVTRITLDGGSATGVEILHHGQQRKIATRHEVIVSLGAVQTPKLLMQSGIGNESELKSFAIPVVQHLPGVGQNLQDHPSVSCIWEFSDLPERQSFQAEAVAFWKSEPHLESPDLLMFPIMVPYTSKESLARFQPKQQSWSLSCVLLHPKSRGNIRLTGPAANDAVRIEARILSDPRDLQALTRGLQVCREIGYSSALASFRGKEVLPGNPGQIELEQIVREGTGNFYHQTGTARIGMDSMAVVGVDLKVHGITNLRIADGSVLPQTITGNTMAACVVVGERAAAMIASQFRL